MDQDQEYEIHCEECGEVSYIKTNGDAFPSFCPLCGAEAEAELTEMRLS